MELEAVSGGVKAGRQTRRSALAGDLYSGCICCCSVSSTSSVLRLKTGEINTPTVWQYSAPTQPHPMRQADH